MSWAQQSYSFTICIRMQRIKPKHSRLPSCCRQHVEHSCLASTHSTALSFVAEAFPFSAFPCLLLHHCHGLHHASLHLYLFFENAGWHAFKASVFQRFTLCIARNLQCRTKLFKVHIKNLPDKLHTNSFCLLHALNTIFGGEITALAHKQCARPHNCTLTST